MSQLDARLGRGDSSVGGLDQLPAMPARDEPDTTAPAATDHVKLRRVVLVDGDQYYREVLTGELLRQGFVVHAFADGAALLGSLATAVDADLAVLDWNLSEMPGIKLLAQLRQHGVNLPVVFLAGKAIAGDDNDQCLLAPQEALDACECMAFDQGAIDFISKSRDRQVLVRRLRNVMELARPKAGLPRQEGLTCGKLLLKPEISRACWNQIDVGLTLREYKLVEKRDDTRLKRGRTFWSNEGRLSLSARIDVVLYWSRRQGAECWESDLLRRRSRGCMG